MIWGVERKNLGVNRISLNYINGIFNFFIFFILVSQLYYYSIKCLKFLIFFYFVVSILFLFNQVSKLFYFCSIKYLNFLIFSFIFV